MKAGVIAVQGAAPEHVQALEAALADLGRKGSVITVRRPADLEQVSCAVIPGGESTTISKLLLRSGLHELVRERAAEGMPIMGTCAGCVLLAKEGDGEVDRTATKLLGLMDMAVDRNAFGRQRESFEAPLDIEGMDGPFPGVFIRGPVIRRMWGSCKIMARHGDRTVMARQENMLALSFHPELSGDLRVHRALLEMV
ncbi:MAG: pyridoxal 5'-phosphate synthase glutaminase subunit PdxT [Methanomassiliicoccus sp.]|nr:pyridoxal 5'-phosphate synthase glutaminase subunit PdxT [Methanomassiliicoccus sp.]